MRNDCGSLMEFEIEGSLERSKNWNPSIHCWGCTMKELLKNYKIYHGKEKKEGKTTNPTSNKEKEIIQNILGSQSEANFFLSRILANIDCESTLFC